MYAHQGYVTEALGKNVTEWKKIHESGHVINILEWRWAFFVSMED